MMIAFSATWRIMLISLFLLLSGIFTPGKVWAASAPASALFALSSTPAIVASAGTVTISGVIQNTASKTEKLTIRYSISGPCSYTDAYTLNVTLQPGESQSASVTRTAPACSGSYTITGNVFSGPTLITSASTSFTVQ